MNTMEIYKSLNLFQEIHMRKSQSFCLTQKKWANLSGWEAKLKGRIITSTLATQHRRLVNHKILFKKQRALQKEREASTLKSFPCPQQQQQQKRKKKEQTGRKEKKTTEVKQNTGKCFIDKIATW